MDKKMFQTTNQSFRARYVVAIASPIHLPFANDNYVC
jgi:hypothetical protein